MGIVHDHCGSCIIHCGLTEECVDGLCVPICFSGEIVCGGVCIDPLTDPNNCEVCGRIYASDESCSGGTCTTASALGCADGTVEVT